MGNNLEPQDEWNVQLIMILVTVTILLFLVGVIYAAITFMQYYGVL